MLGNVTITHKPSGRSRSFDHPRDAVAFINEARAKKILPEQLDIDNRSGVALSVYEDHIPVWAQELIERLELDHGGNIVPKWHWINSKKGAKSSGGRTWYNRAGRVTHISLTAGYDPSDLKGLIIHEFSHAATPHRVHHGREFYRNMFRLLRIYCTPDEEFSIVQREWRYKKSSRYWYAELYNITSILAEYRQPEVYVAARVKPTTAQIIESIFDNIEEKEK